MQITGRSDNQRVDFQQRQIVVFKQLRQTHENLRKLADLLAFQAQFECQFTALVRLCAYQRIDFGLQDFFRSFFRNRFNFNTTFGGGHEYDTSGTTVYNRAQIKLLVDVSQGFNQNFANRLAVLVGLESDQLLAQPLLGKGTDVVGIFNQLYTC